MSPTHTRSTARAAGIVGLVLVLAGVPAPPSSARGDQELFGYTVAATGTALSAFPTIPALLPVEAPFEATVSLATATLSSGGQGFGRASTFFPGTPIAGIRPLLEIGTGTRFPIPDYPLVVESREFERAQHNEQPGITMSTDVDPDRAVAVADAGGVVVPEVLSVRSSRTVSEAVRDTGTVTATTTTTLIGVELGGTVRIESITSIATVTSDAAGATCDGGTTVTGVTVDGRPATLDADGLHLEDVPVAPTPALGSATAPLLEPAGVDLVLLGDQEGCTGATGSRSTMGLLVSVPLPSAGSVPPGGRFEAVLASASAAAGASALPELELPTLAPAAPVHEAATPAGTGDGSGAAPVPGASAVAAPRAPDVGTVTASPVALPGTEPIAYAFAGVPLPMVAGLGLLTVPASRRVRRYMERILSLGVTG
jgi:hypothetical protein